MGRKKQNLETEISSNGDCEVFAEEPIQTSGYAQAIDHFPKPLKSNITEKTKNPSVNKAVALEKFMIQVPMPGQKNGAYCVIKIKQGQEIVDPYLIKFLQKTSKPVKYL